MFNLVFPEEGMQMIMDEFRKIVREELAAIKPEVPEKLLSPAEASKVFGVSTKTITNWQNQGLIESKLIGRRRFFRQSDLVEAGKSLKKYKRV